MPEELSVLLEEASNIKMSDKNLEVEIDDVFSRLRKFDRNLYESKPAVLTLGLMRSMLRDRKNSFGGRAV